MALTAQCESCRLGMTIEMYCADKTNEAMVGCASGEDQVDALVPGDQKCCDEQTPTCVGCVLNISPDEVCARKDYANLAGCDQFRMCCRAYIASCMACSLGLPVDEYCATRQPDEHIVGCEDNSPRELGLVVASVKEESCCRAFTAECMSCVFETTETEVCNMPRFVDRLTGCPSAVAVSACCDEYSLECVSCTLRVAPEELCKILWYKESFENECLEKSPPANKACCMAYDATCMSCVLDTTPEDLCAHPDYRTLGGCDEVRLSECGTVVNAENLACLWGSSKEDICRDMPELDGCPPPSRRCCRAMTASCMACSLGISEFELCSRPRKNGEFIRGCPAQEPQVNGTELALDTGLRGDDVESEARGCCRALTQECVACVVGVTREKLCRMKEYLHLCNAQARVAQTMSVVVDEPSPVPGAIIAGVAAGVGVVLIGVAFVVVRGGGCAAPPMCGPNDGEVVDASMLDGDVVKDHRGVVVSVSAKNTDFL
jgi:hypothetical protein